MITKVKITADEVIEDGVIEVSEAAKKLGCSVSTVYDIMADNALPFIKVRSARKIPLAGLRKYIRENLIQS